MKNARKVEGGVRREQERPAQPVVRSRREPWVVLAMLVSLCTWAAERSAHAQGSAFRLASVPEGLLEVAIPTALHEAPLPALPGNASGQLKHMFSDYTAQPLTVWVQVGPAQLLEALPPVSDATTEDLARGFAAAVPGAYEIHMTSYDANRGALGIKFRVRGDSRAGFQGAISSFYGVAFLNRLSTVLVLSAAAVEREEDAAAAAGVILEHTTLHSEARLPVEDGDAWSAPKLGRRIGIVLGSFIGAFMLGGSLSWLLVKLKVAERPAIIVACVVLMAFGVYGLVRAGASVDSTLQLVSYVLASAAAYALLGKWLSTTGRKQTSSRNP